MKRIFVWILFFGFSRLSAKENLQECIIVQNMMLVVGVRIGCTFKFQKTLLSQFFEDCVLCNCVFTNKVIVLWKMVLLLYKKNNTTKIINLNNLKKK